MSCPAASRYLLVVCASMWMAIVQQAVGSEIEVHRREAIQRLALALAEARVQPKSTQRSLDIAHHSFFLGQVMETAAKEERLTLFEAGERSAASVLQADPDNKAAILWRAMNELGAMQVTRPISGLWRLPRVRDEMEQLRVADERFEYGAADRALASVYRKVPWMFKAAAVKAEHHFQRALEISPHFPANWILYAKFLCEQERVEDAKKLLARDGTPGELAAYPLYENRWWMSLIRLNDKIDAATLPGAAAGAHDSEDL